MEDIAFSQIGLKPPETQLGHGRFPGILSATADLLQSQRSTLVWQKLLPRKSDSNPPKALIGLEWPFFWGPAAITDSSKISGRLSYGTYCCLADRTRIFRNPARKWSCRQHAHGDLPENQRYSLVGRYFSPANRAPMLRNPKLPGNGHFANPGNNR